MEIVEMIDAVEGYIKERKGVDVHILHPETDVQLILLRIAYEAAVKWKQNKEQ